MEYSARNGENYNATQPAEIEELMLSSLVHSHKNTGTKGKPQGGGKTKQPGKTGKR